MCTFVGCRTRTQFLGCQLGSSSSSSRIYYFDREGPTDVAGHVWSLGVRVCMNEHARECTCVRCTE